MNSPTWIIVSAFVSVALLVGFSLSAAADSPQHSLMNHLAKNKISPEVLEEHAALCEELIQEPEESCLTTAVEAYIFVSTSGTERAFHLFLKIPRLLNMYGVVFAGMILYPKLTAVTTVWKLANGTDMEVVDIGIGPHLVAFTGIGYSHYKRNIASGKGSMVAMCLTQPTIMP
ncbi:MAG: hypothetical protein JXA00_05985 [Candidatus Thermoplasmatota archaeon]|nr:hypothetical protein [Candidatus Thermoplasmatota archaeon]